MACMSDRNHRDYKCTYKPCGHTGTKMLHKYDMGKTEHCPKCGLFTYSRFIDFKISDEVMEKIAKLTLKTPKT